MKKNNIWSLATIMSLLMTILASCSFDPEGMPDIPELQPVSNLSASVSGFDVNLAWTLPAGAVTGVRITRDGNEDSPTVLEGRPTTFTAQGQPMGVGCFYTVKVLYEGGYVSEGVTVNTLLPEMDLPNVTDLTASVKGRTVTLNWTLPSSDDITGVRVVRNGDLEAATLFEGAVTTCSMRTQPMDEELNYTVQVIYRSAYPSAGASVKTTIPYITPSQAFLLLAGSPSQLADDDERAAATWFSAQPHSIFVTPSELQDLDPDVCPVLWVMVDRVGLPLGWENLPAEVSSPATIQALKNYSANGGNLYLSNMATQLTVPLGIVPDTMAPTVFGSGAGGSGNDVWVLNAYLGWDFRNGSDQGFYDRTAHAIYKGLTFSDPNGYGYDNLPLIGPGQREDHNCLWDCNLYGRGSQPDVIRNFEVTTNSMVLATWGHVRDHCVAAIVDFYANAGHGRCVANGLAAYEWNQNSGANPYQNNIEKLTSNILEYLK